MEIVLIATPSKRDELDVLFYEIEMLNKSFLLKINSKNMLENCRIESFLIHARNLIDFLEDHKMNKDDILCSNFIDKDEKNIKKVNISIPWQIKRGINKHLSHLTLQRTKEKLSWNMKIIKDNINKGLSVFLKQISSKYFPTKGGLILDDFIKLIQ